jgi:ankyrin repeat protein
MQVALLLIEHGAEVNYATATGRTPLHCAVEHDQLDAALLLLQVHHPTYVHHRRIPSSLRMS